MNSPLLDKSIEALKYNDLGKWTRPAPGLYPHQWLWDSCFIGIGLRHVNVKRAQKEIESLFRGQWSNGMIPHMIFNQGSENYHAGPNLWESKLSPYAPRRYETSGITQPPLIAEAMVRIGKKMTKSKRIEWYKKLYPNLLAYHEWFYEERDPHNEGLIILIHPWETGLDNTPPWMKEMAENAKPIWIKIVEILNLDRLFEKIRRDTRQVPADERATTIESLMLYHVVRRQRRKAYDIDRILKRSYFSIEDLFVNSILIRNNTLLQKIAKEINEQIPNTLLSSMHRTEKALSKLWDEDTKQYYSRSFITQDLIKESTIATFLPLYSGVISQNKAKQLVELMKNDLEYGAKYPIPSVSQKSDYFNHRRYWQGPTWINTNWLIIDGLKRYGFKDEAEFIKQKSLELVDKNGCHEYFSPIDGFGAGIEPFSWTAALTIDLLQD